jgi:carboxypeptidase C (cathepsin A)
MQDFVCNWLGNRRWVDQLQWEGAEGWKAADRDAAGTYTAYGGLSFVKVFDAGHLVRSPPTSCRLRLSVLLSQPWSSGDDCAHKWCL